MKRRLLLLMLALSPVFVNYAQQALPQQVVVPTQNQPLTLKEVVDIALQNNLQVRRGIYNVQSFNINLTQAKMQFLPTVNAGGSYGLNFGRALNPVTNIYVDRDSKTLNLQANA